MIAKLIAHAPTREAAAAKLAAACRAVEVWPVKTNAAFLARAAADPDFVAGRIDTGFIERHAELVPGETPSPEIIAQAAQALLPSGDGPWAALTGFRAGTAPESEIAVSIAGHISSRRPSRGAACGLGRCAVRRWPGLAVLGAALEGGAEAGAGDGAIVAPMPGR